MDILQQEMVYSGGVGNVVTVFIMMGAAAFVWLVVMSWSER